MRVLVFHAVEAEFAPWRNMRELREISAGGRKAYRLQVGRAAVDFVATGMGARSAQHAAESAIAKEYAFCVTAGFAGALNSSVRPGNIVVADQVQHGGNGGTVGCARNLVWEAQQDGAARISTLLTSDHVVTTAEEKRRLAPFAEAVDMESFAILREAREKKIPGVAIRVISDGFDRDLPVDIDTLVDEHGKVRIGGVVKYVARHPLAVPALVRLGRESKTAAHALANFLEGYIKKISFSEHGYPPPELQEVAAR